MSRLMQLGLLALGFFSAAASAESLPVFPYTVPTSSLACANYGDFVSCSAQYLNFVATGSVSGSATIDYVDHAPEGALKDPIVIFTGSAAAASNAEYGTTLDNAYQPAAGAGSLTEYGTHLNTGSDPTPTFTGDHTGVVSNTTAWDISLSTLITALTDANGRHQMLIFFDNNQIGTDPGQNIMAWALVCVQGAGKTEKCFELNGVPPPPAYPGPDVTTFTTTKSFGDAPSAADYVLVNGTICVDNTTKLPVAFNTSACPAGSTLINNNLGTNETEFIEQIPELDASLESLLAQGYTNVSVQFRFTNNNDGFEDIYIRAGALITQVPEPGTVALFALALIGFGFTRLRPARR